MILALNPAGEPVAAEPSRRALPHVCPSCREPVIAHCGPLRRWHWAHEARDCDLWSEPETEWHRSWKSLYMADHGADVEVPVARDGKTHRADVITPRGVVVELQYGYLSPRNILKREQFWPREGRRLMWIYDASRFLDRLHFGERGFWWKHGSRAMATHRWPVWWHAGDELWRVTLNSKQTSETHHHSHIADRGDEHICGKYCLSQPITILGPTRVLGRVLDKKPVVEWFPSYEQAQHGPRT